MVAASREDAQRSPMGSNNAPKRHLLVFLSAAGWCLPAADGEHQVTKPASHGGRHKLLEASPAK